VVMLSITGLGLAILAANYIPTIVMMRRVLRGNVPESLPAESYAKVVVAKVVFALLLAMLAGSKPFGPAAPSRSTCSLAGTGILHSKHGNRPSLNNIP
jgi:ABC-type lipoprotein release transport system permease subunit